MLTSQTISSLLDGVSQLPKRLRASSQAEEQINGLSSKNGGLRKRPPTEHKALLSADTSGFDSAFITSVDRDETERYHVVVVNGQLKVFDSLTGASETVIAPRGLDYLADSSAGFKAFTVGDYTFVLNLAQVVKQGSKKAAAQANEALVFVRQADFSTRYAVTINDEEVAIVTVDMAAASSRAQISTTNIAADLMTALLANETLAADFTFTQYGSTIYLTRKDGKDFTLKVEDGLADHGLKAVKGSVQTFEDLPARAKNGMVVEIAGDPTTGTDNWWVRYDDDGTPGQSGVWRECPKPGTPLALDATTMPWALVRRGVIEKQTASRLPFPPLVMLGATVTYTVGFTSDPDTGETFDPDTDQGLWSHGHRRQAILDAGLDGTSRALHVNYDVDTTLVEQGVHTEVRLVTDTGGGPQIAARRFYQPGQQILNETLGSEADLPAGTTVTVETYYSTGATPTSPYRRSQIVLHRANHPTVGGIRYVQAQTTRVQFQSGTYPAGTTVTLTVDGKAFSKTLTGDETMAQLASDFVALIDPDASFNAQGDTVGALLIGRASGGTRPTVKATLSLDPKVFYSRAASFIANEHVGRTIRNITDGSTASITANSPTSVTTDGLTGGTDNTFQPGDICEIVGAGQYFVFDQVEWGERVAGDLDIAPFPSFVDRPIREVFFYQNRLGFTSNENIVLSRSGDLFGFTRQTARQLLDDDPIDVKSALKDVAMFDHAVLWSDGIYLFSGAGHQFRLSGEPMLTPNTVRLDHVGSFPVDAKVRPLTLGTSILIPHAGTVSEFYRRDAETYDAQILTTLIPKYITGSPLALTGDAAQEIVTLLTDGGAQDTLYVYAYHDDGGKRLMSSWSKWTFSGAKILALDTSRGLISLIVKRADGVYLESIDLTSTPSDFRDRQGAAAPEAYTFRYRFTTIYPRDQNDVPDTHGRLQLRYFTLFYHDSTEFDVTVTHPWGSPGSTPFRAAVESEGKLRVAARGQSTGLTIEIVSSGSGGCAFSGAEWEGTYSSRSQRA